jgi:deoxyribodipyrimidine photolyase
MPTSKHRIAAYLPPEVDEKFQAFKQERGVGDSQALIMILTEFLEVSQLVSHNGSLDIEVLKSELLSELLSELDSKFSELKSELLSKPLESVVVTQESLKDVNIRHDSLINAQFTSESSSDLLEAVKVDLTSTARLTIAQLSAHFGCDPSLLRKQKSKYRDEPEKFEAWSKSRDPDGYGWKFDEADRVFDRICPTKPIPSP